MQFFNRITREIAKELPDSLILGEWQVLAESDRIFVNTFELPQGAREYLFPDATYRWALRYEDGRLKLEKHFSIWQMPSDLVSESIRFFERRLQELVSSKASWYDWVQVPPLVPEIEQKIHIQPLEITTKKDIGHIEEVCYRPRTYLKMETERLPVSRAQRISPHATEFLASHTEDWERRTFRSVLPKRVLCLVREELWDIYENKVTARLIDNLLEYLRQRMAEVQTLKQELEEAEYFSGETSDIHWRNRQRIYTLWGENFDASAGIREADATLRELKQLQYKLRGLIDTELYQSIPQRASVGNTLKRTNILVNDQHYRYVDLLWREWNSWKSGQTKNSRQVFEENRELFKGFECFCLLLIGRSLTGMGNDDDKGLGFDPVTCEIPARGDRSIQLRGPLGEVSLNWQEDGSFLLKSDGIRNLRFIPLIAPLTATKDSEVLEIIVNNITCRAETQTQFSDIVILYPGTEEERKKLRSDLQRKINSLGNDRLPGELPLSILPVSPLEIISVERVARAIKWWFCSQYYLSYPPIFSKKIPDSLQPDADWLLKDNQPNQFLVLRQPLATEEQVFNTSLDRLVNEAKGRGPAGKGQLLALQQLSDLPSKTKELIQPLLVCPTCHSPGNFNALDNSQCFRCECGNCASSWGTRTCGNCGKKYPYIQLSRWESSKKPRQPGWVDRTLGRDVLAIPCWRENEQDSFICSYCGTCSQAGQASQSKCLRCHQVVSK